MEIYKLLLKNSLLENNAFVLASMHILKNRIGMDEFNYFSQLELKIIMKNCFSASISCMQSSILAYLLPYPFISTTTEVSISTVFIIVLKNVIYNVITIGVSTIEIQIALPRLIADFSKTVYIAFTNNELLVTNAADVLSVCLENEKFAVSDTLHDSVIKLIKQSYFLELFKGKPQVLMKWIFIVKTISVSFYKEKNKLLEIVIEIVKPNIFTQIFYKNLFKPKSLFLLVFVILTEESISNSEILLDLADILFNTFGIKETFKVSCLILKSIYLKVTPKDFNEIVSRILPQLFPVMMKMAQNKDSDLLDCLELLKFFRIIENEIFLMLEGSIIHHLYKLLEPRSTSLQFLDFKAMNSSKTETELETEIPACLWSWDSNETIIEQAIHYAVSHSLHTNKPFDLETNNFKLVEESIISNLIN